MRRFTAFYALVLCVLSGLATASPHLTIDLDSGRVLSQRQAFDVWHPASLTKLMTAYVAFNALQSGEISPDDPVVISRLASRQPPSKMGYGRGTVISVEDALKLVIIKSANDVSVALAETIAGSVDAFADRMNAQASRLGMKDSRFVNPHGLHDARQVVTAHDLALLLQALHKTYPQYREWFSAAGIRSQHRTKKKKIIERIHYSYNLLLERYRGADGFKTGFVCASGYNFAGSATRAGRRIAAIVLGRDSQTTRAVDAAKLITQGFELPLTAGIPIEELTPDANRRTSPRNMRSILCTPEARAKRYEPGAGLAVIKSPWLGERIKQEITVRTVLQGNRKRRPVTIPTPRPQYTPPKPFEGGAQTARRTVTLPTFRPTIGVN